MQKDFTVADARDEPGPATPVTPTDAGLSLEDPKVLAERGPRVLWAPVPSGHQQFPL